MIPTLPGVPSWGAMLIALTCTVIGFAFDAGSGGKELTVAFAAAYAIGCVAAVVAVRQTGVFTAVIQPPLVLFVTVPGAYFLFHSGTMDGLKDLLINCGYPLIERFPLMFFTSAIVLLIGLLRWYLGMSSHRKAPAEPAEDAAHAGVLSALTAKISGLLARGNDDDAVEERAPRRSSRQHSISRSAKSTARAGKSTARASKSTARTGKSTAEKAAAGSSRTRSGRPAKRTQPSRSRHTRPPETEIIEAVTDHDSDRERPRRPRTEGRSTERRTSERRTSERRATERRTSERRATERRTSERRITDQKSPAPEPRRRTRTSSTREPRSQPPPSDRRSPYQRSERHSRFDGFEPFEPHGSTGSNGNGSNGNGNGALNGTHHPVSRVRYRGADDSDQRPQYRSLPRAGKHQAETWEYDV